MGSYRYRSLIEGPYYRKNSLIGALYTLNSPPVVSFKYGWETEMSGHAFDLDPLSKELPRPSTLNPKP